TGALPIVVVDLEQKAAIRRPEGAVMNTGWTAGVGVGAVGFELRPFSLIPHGEVSRQQENLLPIVMHEGRGGPRARRKPQQSGPIAGLRVLVEHAGEDFLLDSGRIAGRPSPTDPKVNGMEFEMLLVDRHDAPSSR